MIMADGQIFEGNYDNSILIIEKGYGVLRLNDRVYVGQLKDKVGGHGKGKLYKLDGTVKVGVWKDGNK